MTEILISITQRLYKFINEGLTENKESQGHTLLNFLYSLYIKGKLRLAFFNE